MRRSKSIMKLEFKRGNPLLANECIYKLNCQDITGKISRCFTMLGCSDYTFKKLNYCFSCLCLSCCTLHCIYFISRYFTISHTHPTFKQLNYCFSCLCLSCCTLHYIYFISRYSRLSCTGAMQLASTDGATSLKVRRTLNAGKRQASG